jgi:uncharacterized protein (DUF433 family)
MDLLDRIEINPEVLKGKAVIKGTRLSVQYILGLLGSGADFEEILDEYNTLKKEDILACLLFASKTLEDQLFFPFSKDVA